MSKLILNMHTKMDGMNFTSQSAYKGKEELYRGIKLMKLNYTTVTKDKNTIILKNPRANTQSPTSEIEYRITLTNIDSDSVVNACFS